MIFERGRHTTCDFYLNNTKLDIVSDFKYLGVTFYKNNKWQRTQKNIANNSLFALHNLFTAFNQIDLQTSQKCKLFDALVGAKLNYGAAIWGNHEATDIEAIHTKFCRKILGVRKSTNLDALYGELGRYPMYITRQTLMIKYWLKIMTMDENSLVYRIYKTLEQDAINNDTYNGENWATQIKINLDNIGMSYIWHNRYNMLIDIQPIKQRLLDIYKQQWYVRINNSKRLESYCMFKHNFTFEKYLDCIKENKYRLALTKFRLSAHDLEIEKGRHNNIPRSERKCKNCNMKQIENEFHFILVCPKYRNLRLKYFKPYFNNWPSINKFEQLMTGNLKTTYNIAKFIFSAIKERQ
jgi:hypothetical protein